MHNDDFLNRLNVGTPGYYRIVVAGRLDPSWSDCLAGMQITVQQDESCATISVLEGNVNDQSELVGVLNGLLDLHMAIRSVELQGK